MALFQPGQSGNPGGRPKGSNALREAMRGHTEDAIAVLKAAMGSDDLKIAVPAAMAILDRGWGKPAQAVEVGNLDGEPFRHSVSVEFIGKTP